MERPLLLKRKQIPIQIETDGLEQRYRCTVVVPYHPLIAALPDDVLHSDRVRHDAFHKASTTFQASWDAYRAAAQRLAGHSTINMPMKIEDITYYFSASRSLPSDITLKIDSCAYHMTAGYAQITSISAGRPLPDYRIDSVADVATLVYHKKKSADALLMPERALETYEGTGNDVNSLFSEILHDMGSRAFSSSLFNVPAFCSTESPLVFAFLFRDWAVAYQNVLLKWAIKNQHKD